MFLDRATIRVRSGDGGNGCVSFHRTRRNQRGGPDGGNGGDGGSVYLEASPQLTTLYDFTHKPVFAADNGSVGGRNNRTGRKGDNLVIALPVGTEVRIHESGIFAGDLVTAGQTLLVARGGSGGKGNKAFTTSTRQSPREAEQGAPGMEVLLDLELKLIADVGLIGLPNAGKSTLLRCISRAHPKVADYPFTTLHPHLGISVLDDLRQIVVADIPGLIKDAHKGAGLGHDFLRHIERTKVLAHLITAEPENIEHMARSWNTIHNELTAHSGTLAEKKALTVLTKLDLFPPDTGRHLVKKLSEKLGREVIGISSVTHEGIDRLLEAFYTMASTQSD